MVFETYTPNKNEVNNLTVAESVKQWFLTILNSEEVNEYKDLRLSNESIKKIQAGENIAEVSKYELDFLRSGIDMTWTVEGIKEPKEIGKIKENFKWLEWSFDGIIDSAWNSEIWKKAKVWFKEVKEKIGSAGMWVTIAKGFNSFAEKIGSWLEGIMKFFSNLFKWLMWFLGFWEKVGEVVDKVSDVLNPETRKETIKWLEAQLITAHPEKSEQIKKAISEGKINEDALVVISEKLQKWEKVTLTDFYTLRPELKDLLFTKEELTEKVESVKQKMFLSMKSELEKKLSIDTLTPEQSDELLKTINELWINESTVLDLEKDFRENDRINMANIIPLIRSLWMESSTFILKLVYRWIIPTSHIASEFAGAWYDTLKLSIAPLGIFEKIDINAFSDMSWDMTDQQKSILTMLIYKKWGLLFKTAWFLTESLMRVWVEAATSTTVKWVDIYKAGFNNDYQKQIDNLKEIWKVLWDKNIDWSISILKEAQDNLNDVVKNYKYLHVLQDSQYKNVWEKINALSKYWLNIEKLSSTMSQSELNHAVSKNHIKINFAMWVFDKGWLWINAKNSIIGLWWVSDLQDFNKVLNATWKSQKLLASGSIWWKILWKGLEMMHLPDISRLWDRLVFNFKSVWEAKVFSELIKRSPEMIWWIMGKLPIISIIWLSSMQEWDFMENIWNSLVDLIPFVGPINMISEWTLTWIKSGELNLENMTTMWAGFLLLGIDGIFWFKEIAKWIANWTWWFSWLAKYMAQPFKDIYWIGRGIWEFWYVALKWAPGSLKELTKQVLNKTKNLKWKVRAIVILWLLWAWASKLAFADDSQIDEYMNEDWLDVEKIKNNSLSQEEKLETSKYLFVNSQNEKFTKDIQLDIIDNQLHIISKNESVVENWVINDSITELLKLNPIINFKYIWTSENIT